jgi:geranylgeranyl diphosphate synthase type I
MKFKEGLKTYKDKIDKEIETYLDEKIERSKGLGKIIDVMYRSFKTYLMRGGKRLRPVSLIFAYKGFSDNESQILGPAISVELFHNSTLLHDDIMDKAPTRRGEPSFHVLIKNQLEGIFKKDMSRFSNSIAILGGNVLVSCGIETILNSEFDSDKIKRALTSYIYSYNILNDGQAIDLAFEQRDDVSEQEYYDMVMRKTGTLFRTSVEVGSILGGADPETAKRFGDAILDAAIAFQIQDDLLDLSPTEKFGKVKGGDVKEGKRTLMVIKSLEQGSEDQKKKILSVLGNEQASPEEIDQAVELLDETGGIPYAKEKCRSLILSSKEKLNKLGLNKESIEFFKGFCDFLIEREY